MKTASNSRVLRTIPFILIVVLFCPFAHGKVIHVDDDGQADFDTIQAGIDTAVDGDTVLVSPGEYIIIEPITFRGKAITVRAEAGPDVTIIRMGTPADTNRGSVVVFENNETDESILEGFTITWGKGCWRSDPYPPANRWSGLAGGGILCWDASPTILACTITQNTAAHGGGVFCLNSDTILTDCIAENCSATENGGGLTAASESSLTLTDCIIRSNSAPGAAGGVFSWDNSSVTMTDCTIAENSAGQAGGGVLSGENSSSVTMTHCAIVGNTAGIGGGGLETWHQASATVTNCVIAQNTTVRGGGIICAPYGYQGCSMTVTNSIIWGNNASQGREIRVENLATFSISYSNIDGGHTGVSVESHGTLNWGAGNIDADPHFAEPNNEDYYLKSQAGRFDPNTQTWVVDDVTSPCIDTGDPNTPVAFEPYPNGGIVNMGAYGGTTEASKSPSGLHANYGGGTGEPNDPYLIYTAEQMNAIGAEPNDWDKHFELMADIDLSGFSYDRAVIAPDTNDTEEEFHGTAFTGVFDGNSHTISHLTIEGESYLGLFGQLESDAIISNLGLEAVDVTGTGHDVGGLVGSNWGNVTQCYSSGSVSGGGWSVGGLAGYNDGSITSSYNTGTVNGGNETVGGLVGENDGSIATCYSAAAVSGTSGVGGLVGQNSWGSSITASYGTGMVSGDRDVGGLVGFNYGRITTSYSTGTVSGNETVGGLVGFNSGSIITSFWDVETSVQTTSAGGMGKTTAEMQTASTFINAGWDFVDETDNGTDDIWWILEGHDYPRLWWETSDL